MSIELRQLRYFRSLARELNVMRAAAAVSVSQSSMSEQMLRLEDILGVSLLDRTNRRVKLTAAGELLRDQLEPLLAQVDQLVERVRLAGGVARRSLRIGYSEMAVGTMMPSILHVFREQYPSVDTVMREQSSIGAERALLDGQFDCVFVPGSERPANIASLDLGTEPVLLCVASSSPLATKPHLTLGDLRDVPLILPDSASKLAQYVQAEFERAGIEPRVVTRAARALSILTLVASEEGVALVPGSLSWLAPAGVVVRSLDKPDLQIHFSMIWRAGSDDPAVADLIEVARGFQGRTPTVFRSDIARL